MGKFSRNLGEDLAKKVKSLAAEMHLNNYVSVEPIALKSKKDIGVVVKGNELVSLFTGDDTLIAVGINEEAFDRVDEQTQDIWIRGLLSQIHYDIDKDKISIEKPELQVSLSEYHQFGELAVKKAELAILTLQQITEEEEARKTEAKAAKSKKKK